MTNRDPFDKPFFNDGDDEDPFDDPFFDDAKSDMSKGFGGIIVAQIAVIGLVIAGAIVAAYLTWTHAPAVGGEWWPYIRALASLLAAGIGAKIAGVVGYLLVMAVVGTVVAVGGR